MLLKIVCIFVCIQKLNIDKVIKFALGNTSTLDEATSTFKVNYLCLSKLINAHCFPFVCIIVQSLLRKRESNIFTDRFRMI